LEKNWNKAIQIIRKEFSAEDYYRLGERCITDYYRRYFPFDQGRTLGLEENIYFPLEEEKGYWIRGLSIDWTLLIIPFLKYMTIRPPIDLHSGGGQFRSAAGLLSDGGRGEMGRTSER